MDASTESSYNMIFIRDQITALIMNIETYGNTTIGAAVLYEVLTDPMVDLYKYELNCEI